jgi:hypothetical protein
MIDETTPGELAFAVVYDPELSLEDRAAALGEIAAEHPDDPEVQGYFEMLVMERLAGER